MAGCEITVIGDKGLVTWLAGTARVGEVYMTDVANMVIKVLEKAGTNPIARLNILDHGFDNAEACMFGSDKVSAGTFSKFESCFVALREFFAEKAIVHLQHCHVGKNQPLMIKFAKAFQRPVYAGTWYHNPLARVQYGDYVRCSSAGVCTVGVDRP